MSFLRAPRCVAVLLAISVLGPGLFDPPCRPSAAPGISPRPASSLARPSTPIYTCKIVNTYPHDSEAFTQGLVFENGVLYESTGLHGRSSVRKVDLRTGAVLQIQRLPPQLFGEGITVFGDRLIQLTWQSGVGLVYEKKNFRLLKEFSYPTEGWGLTHDGRRLIMSDGTATLRFLEPETFKELGSIAVFDRDGPVGGLNELEYVRGELFANVWPTNRIVRIDPASGRVLAWIDLEALARRHSTMNPDAVLNGIAYDPRADRLFVTGKLWPSLYEIKLVPLNK